MSNKKNQKRSKRRTKAYRQIAMYVNLFFLAAIVIFVITGALHIFTHKRDYRDEGVALYEQGQYADAIEAFDKALDCKQWFAGKLNVDIELYKAECYLQMEDYRSAGQVYTKIGNEYPKKFYDADETAFMVKLCEALDSYASGDYSSPVSCFAEAVDRGYMDICMYAASCYEHKQNYEKMTSYYDIYIEKMGINSYVCYKYADYYLYEEDYNTALSFVNQGIMLGGQDYMQNLKYLEIVCYTKLTDYSQAYTLAQTYCASYPDDTAGADMLAYLDTRVNPDTTLVNDVYGVGSQSDGTASDDDSTAVIGE